MKIHFEREGGYINIPLKYEADTDELPKEIAQRLSERVRTSGVLDLKQEDIIPRPHAFPDVFSYRLAISEGDRRISLSFNDLTAPESLRPLLELLQEFWLEKH